MTDPTVCGMGKKFTVAIGLNYGDDKRAEIGDVVDDLTDDDDIVNLLALGAIVPLDQKRRG